MSLTNLKAIQYAAITREWKPSIAFKLRMTAEQKRAIHAFHRMKLYRDRIGKPIRYYADPLATDEIHVLNWRIVRLSKMLTEDYPPIPSMQWSVTEAK